MTVGGTSRELRARIPLRATRRVRLRDRDKTLSRTGSSALRHSACEGLVVCGRVARGSRCRSRVRWILINVVCPLYSVLYTIPTTIIHVRDGGFSKTAASTRRRQDGDWTNMYSPSVGSRSSNVNSWNTARSSISVRPPRNRPRSLA